MRSDISSGKAVVKSQGKSCYRVKRGRVSKAGSAKELVKAAQYPMSPPTQEGPTPPTPTTSSSPATPVTTTAVIRKPFAYPQQPQVMLQHLAHANDMARCMQSVLTDIRSHVYEVISRKPDWHLSRTSKIGLINAYDYTSYDHFVVAMDAFLKNEHTNGGEILRQAFLEVEEAIQTDYSCTFYFFFIDLPDLFLHYGRHDILTILLGHIKRLTGAVGLRDKIPGTGLASLHALAETDPAFLRHYIATASGLWCDLLTELRGPRDRSTLLARRNWLRHDRSADHRQRVGRLCEDYVGLLDDVHAQYGQHHDMSLHMEDVCLSLQMSHDFFVDNFVAQNDRLARSVEEKYRVAPAPLPPAPDATAHAFTSLSTRRPSDQCVVDVTDLGEDEAAVLPVETWDVLDRNIRSNCYHRLSYFFQLHGDQARSRHYIAKAVEGWRGDFWHLEAEGSLVAVGRHFEAESLRRCRLEAQYYRKLPENDKLLVGHGEFPGIRGPGINAEVLLPQV